jgi:hypothetical protein
MKKLLIVSGALFFILLAIASARAASVSKTPTPSISVVEFTSYTDIKAVSAITTVKPKLVIDFASYFIWYSISYAKDKKTAYVKAEFPSKYKAIVEKKATDCPDFKISKVYYKPTPTVTRTQ